MSIVRPPAPALRPVNDLLACDEPGHKDPSPVFEDRHALDELPQGALVLLAQLQPLRELPLKLSMAAPRSGTEPRLANVWGDRTMLSPMKQPPVPSSPAQVDARLRLAARLPLAMQPQVHDQAAVASAVWASDHAVADRLVRQESPQALPAQPLPLFEKSLYLNHVTRSAMPAKATPESPPVPDVSITRGGRHYLQVPFSKGDAVGLITVSKAGAERPEQLLLNPGSASVFSCLSDSLAQVPDPRWRLADQQAHEDPHERERPDEEVEEESRHTLQGRIEHEGLQA